MIILEFKKEKHDENVKLAHQIKESVCKLVDNMMEGAVGERHHEDPYMFDERIGGGRMGRREDMEINNRGGYRGQSGSAAYYYPMPYNPYHHGMVHPTESFDDRYNY